MAADDLAVQKVSSKTWEDDKGEEACDTTGKPNGLSYKKMLYEMDKRHCRATVTDIGSGVLEDSMGKRAMKRRFSALASIGNLGQASKKNPFTE